MYAWTKVIDLVNDVILFWLTKKIHSNKTKHKLRLQKNNNIFCYDTYDGETYETKTVIQNTCKVMMHTLRGNVS